MLLLLKAKHALNAQVALMQLLWLIPQLTYNEKSIIRWLLHWQPCAPV